MGGSLVKTEHPAKKEEIDTDVWSQLRQPAAAACGAVSSSCEESEEGPKEEDENKVQVAIGLKVKKKRNRSTWQHHSINWYEAGPFPH